MPESESVSGVQQVASAVGRYRWVICALLFFGVTKNYMDRQVLGLLKGTLQQQMGWNDIDYGNLVVAFQIAYAVGMVTMGRVIDRFGTRTGYAFAMVFWSLASMAHAAAGSMAAFLVARAALGFGEAGVFPASIKTVAEWFPKKERSFATGIFNAGTNVGAILAPPMVAAIVLHSSWQWAFIITGALGFVWLGFWLTMYRTPEEHPRVSPAELAYIKSDPQESVTKIPWLRLLPHRQTWTFVMAKGLTDPIWWFYLFWAPDFFFNVFHVKLSGAALPIMVIYTIGDVGSVAGGWLPTRLIKNGFSVNAARKLSMLVCALCVLPVMMAPSVSMWTAVFLIGLAAAAHQGFSANVFTLTSDMFPSRAVGSVTGLGGMAGAVGGMFSAKLVAYILFTTHSNYRVPFLLASGAYLTALAVVQVLSPNLEPANLSELA